MPSPADIKFGFSFCAYTSGHAPNTYGIIYGVLFRRERGGDRTGCGGGPFQTKLKTPPQSNTNMQRRNFFVHHQFDDHSSNPKGQSGRFDESDDENLHLYVVG